MRFHNHNLFKIKNAKEINIKETSNNFNEVYFKKIEKLLYFIANGSLKNYSVIFSNNKSCYVSESNKAIGKKLFFGKNNRSMSEHAELVGLKNFIRNNKKIKLNRILLFSFRAYLNDLNNIVFSNGKLCLNCYKVLIEKLNIKNIFFTLNEEKMFYKIISKYDVKNTKLKETISLSSYDRSFIKKI